MFKLPDAHWDQNEDLRPPPYTGAMKDMLPGLNVGDVPIDALPMSAVCCHGGKAKGVFLQPEPAWVDWAQVRRGQEAYNRHLMRNFVSLTISLLQGFSIGRFAEVLVANGYAQNAHTAFERYRETAFAITDWMRYPLDEPGSVAREQLANVRGMHSFARRRAAALKIFDAEKGEGVALSQYDMVEVLIGFAGIAPTIVEIEFGGPPCSREEKRDILAAWRLIGFHLGIEDRFNPCVSLEYMEAIVEDWMQWTPLRLKTCRPSTFELQRTALEGFGQYSGTGVELFVGMLESTCNARGFEIDYLKRKSLPGLADFGKLTLCSTAFDAVNKVGSSTIHNQRDMWLNNPGFMKRMMPVLKRIAYVQDLVFWRVVGILTLISKRVLGTAVRRFVVAYVFGFLVARRLHSIRSS